ncbi:MAG: hypothetical protein AAGB19_02840 [Cyanobacteria bacterium P01_F01_bin.3]
MPIAVGNYTPFKGFAISASDIQLGEVESKTLPVVSEAGQLLNATFRRYSLRVTVRGIRQNQADPFLLSAQQANLNLFNGSPQKENITLLGRIIYECVLVDAQISQPISVASTELVEQMTLTYESQVFV